MVASVQSVPLMVSTLSSQCSNFPRPISPIIFLQATTISPPFPLFLIPSSHLTLQYWSIFVHGVKLSCYQCLQMENIKREKPANPVHLPLFDVLQFHKWSWFKLHLMN